MTPGRDEWAPQSEHVLKSIERHDREISQTRSDILNATSAMNAAIADAKAELHDEMTRNRDEAARNHEQTRAAIAESHAKLQASLTSEISRRSSLSGRFDIVQIAVVATIGIALSTLFQLIVPKGGP